MTRPLSSYLLYEQVDSGNYNFTEFHLGDGIEYLCQTRTMHFVQNGISGDYVSNDSISNDMAYISFLICAGL